MITFSGFADEVAVSFKEQLDFLSAAGISHIELRFVNGVNAITLGRERLTEATMMLNDYDIGVSALASPIGKVRIDEKFEPHLDAFKHAVELTSLLNTKLLRIFSFYPPENGRIDDHRDVVMERMRTLTEVVSGTDIILVHENEAHIYGYSAENCVDIIQTIYSPNLKLAYDPANFVWGYDILDNVERCFPIMKPYVSHVHIKDWKAGSKDIGALPGTGDAQIEMLIAELASMQYDGFITLEPHMNSGGQYGGETSPEQFEMALNNVKAFCDKYSLSY